MILELKQIKPITATLKTANYIPILKRNKSVCVCVSTVLVTGCVLHIPFSFGGAC